MLLLSRTNCRNPPLYIYNAYKNTRVYEPVFFWYTKIVLEVVVGWTILLALHRRTDRDRKLPHSHTYTQLNAAHAACVHTHIHTTGVDWSSSFKQAHTHHQPKIRKNVDCCYVKNYTHYTIYTFYTVPAISNNTTYFLWFGFGGELTHKLGLRCYCYI